MACGESTDMSLRWRDVNVMLLFNCLLNSLCGPTSKKCQGPYYWPFVRGIHRWAVNSLHKEAVTWKRLLFDDIIMMSHLAGHFSSVKWRLFCLSLNVLKLINSVEFNHWKHMPNTVYFLSNILIFSVTNVLVVHNGNIPVSIWKWLPICST